MTVQVRAEVEGLEDLRASFEALGDESTVAGRAALRATANSVRKLLREAAPVGTAPTAKKRRTSRGSAVYDYGRLRDNIRVREERAREDNTIVFRVHTGNAFWAQFLELGTVHMAARPWARPAMDGAGPGLFAKLSENMGKAIERTARKFGRVLPNGRNA